MPYWISTVALVVIAITMLARANDLKWKGRELRWKFRLFGFLVAGVSPWVIIAMEQQPTWADAVFRLGMMAVLVTTPHLPPWWAWITRGDERCDRGNA